jgi:PKD repeat protein
MLTNNYCYEFWDDDFPGNDSLMLTHEWTFSDGTKKTGVRVTHCFPSAGPHWTKLNIIDERTDTTFYTQNTTELEIIDHEQPFITSNESGVVDVPMEFSGINSNLPGFVIEQYIWEFGDGAFTEGPEVEHVYENSGSYSVRLGLKGHMEGGSQLQIRCVERTIKILQ